MNKSGDDAPGPCPRCGKILVEVGGGSFLECVCGYKFDTYLSREVVGTETEEGGKKKEIPPRRVEVPSLVVDDFIAEEGWDRRNPPCFAVRRFGSDVIEYEDEIDLGEVESCLTEDGEEGGKRKIIYVPIDNGHLREKMVLVPSEAIRADFDEVYREACALAFEIYDCEESKRDEFKLLVAIAIGSWFLDRFSGATCNNGGLESLESLASRTGHGLCHL